jgi:enamine deaminase RidA (YjgF/YER057c/UK114 family)
VSDVTRQRVDAVGPWATPWAYSRAIRVGELVEISGTTAVGPDGAVDGTGDVYQQTRAAIQTIEKALAELGGSLADVVRTRVLLRDIGDWPDAGRAHREVFEAIRPASTCVGGLEFLMPEILVEVEATALIQELPSGYSAPAGGDQTNESAAATKE